MSIFIRGAICAVLFGFAGVMPAKANDATGTPMHVNVPVGQRGTITGAGILAAERDVAAITGGADVVPAREFQKSYALTMKDMTATTPGVLAQPRWGEDQRLSIRGSGLSRMMHLRGIMLLQDGVPFNFADGSGSFQEIDPLMLQHLEVYRGGNGLRYGAATLGGAINMVTPTAHTVDYENGLLRAEGGSYQTLRLHAQAAKVFDGVDMLAAATKSISDGYRRQSEQNNTRFSGNVGIPLGRNAETRFYLNWNDINQEIPGTISRRAALKNPRSVPAVNITGDYARDERSLRVANKTGFVLENGLAFEVGAYANDKFLYHPIFQVLDQNSLDLGGFGRMTGRYGRNEFMLGAKIGRGKNDAKRYLNIKGKRGALQTDAEQIAKNIELYGENRFRITPEWSVTAGAQATIAEREYTDHRNNANNAGKTFRSFNPKVGVMWEPRANMQFFAGVTRSDEVSTFAELVQGAGAGFIPVQSQKAWTAEIGTRGIHGPFSWDVTAYHARLRDELMNYTLAPDVPASTFNADKTIHQGIELGAGWRIGNGFSMQAIYNLSDFRFDGDKQYGDNELAGAPRHQIRLSARYEKSGAYIEPNVEWIPQASYVDYANTLKADSHALVGLKAGYEINDSVSLFFDARNLTNEENIGSFTTITDARVAGTEVFYPGEGRSAFGGIAIKF